MRIRQRNGKFQVDLHLGGQRVRRSFRSHKEAEQFAHEANLRFLNGDPIELAISGEQVTLRSVYESVFKHRWKGTKGEANAVCTAQRVLEILGEHTPAKDIGPSHIDKVIDTLLTDDYSNATINRHLARLKTMLRHAQERGWIDRVPKISMRKEPKGRIRVITTNEEEALLAFFTLNDRRDMRDLVIVMLDTGLRVSNAVALTVTHRVGNRIVLHADEVKGNRTYAVPMTPRVQQIFDRAAAEGQHQIFPKIPSRFAAQRLWDNARAALKLDTDADFVMHACRHTFCSRLIQRGVPLTTVKELAGHSDISLTLRYAHLRDEDLVSAISRLVGPESPGGTSPEEPRLRLVSGA